MNAINLICPYRHHGMWVFDDPRTGLIREPFVAGADTMIDRAVADIPNADEGFNLLFSASPFPTHQIRLEWRRPDGGGNWYCAPQFDLEGWLCPALFKYFEQAPNELFVEVRGFREKNGSNEKHLCDFDCPVGARLRCATIGWRLGDDINSVAEE